MYIVIFLWVVSCFVSFILFFGFFVWFCFGLVFFKLLLTASFYF